MADFTQTIHVTQEILDECKDKDLIATFMFASDPVRMALNKTFPGAVFFLTKHTVEIYFSEDDFSEVYLLPARLQVIQDRLFGAKKYEKIEPFSFDLDTSNAYFVERF